MSHRITAEPAFRLALALAVLLSLFLGCQSPKRALPEFDNHLDAATHTYKDYVRGDCDRVDVQADPERVEEWAHGEIRHAMALVRGFCEEREGKTDEARKTYRELIQVAPLSFAAKDARERLRILRLTQRDPDYKAWVDGAQARHAKRGTKRVPLDRIPAEFPPLAHEADIEGYAVIEFGITPRGDTDSPIIVDSEPPLIFDGAAIRAVRQWRYASDLDLAESQRQVIRIVFRPREAESTLEESEDEGATAFDGP